MKINPIGIVLLCLVFPARLQAADTTEEKKPLGGSTPKKKFEASSLWGVRRGPNAPSPSPSMSALAEEIDKKKAKAAEIAYQEEKAKQAYLNSLSKTPGSSNAVGAAAPKPEECARKK